jgi:mercuric reductase
VAAYEGGIVADNAIGGLNKKIDLTVVPRAALTSLGFATVGLTEKKANERGYEIKTSVLPLTNVARPIVNHGTTGII